MDFMKYLKGLREITPLEELPRSFIKDIAIVGCDSFSRKFKLSCSFRRLVSKPYKRNCLLAQVSGLRLYTALKGALVKDL